MKNENKLLYYHTFFSMRKRADYTQLDYVELELEVDVEVGMTVGW